MQHIPVALYLFALASLLLASDFDNQFPHNASLAHFRKSTLHLLLAPPKYPSYCRFDPLLLDKLARLLCHLCRIHEDTIHRQPFENNGADKICPTPC
jgi:hypothetical protein